MTRKKDHKLLSDSDYKDWLEVSKNIKKLVVKKPKASIVYNPQYSFKPKSENVITPPKVTRSYINIGDSGDLNRKTLRQMNSGKMFIDAKIDLHGLREIEAHDEFQKFIKTSYARNYRLLLIITGKGSSTKPSVIKSRLPMWINSNELSPYILRFSQATVIHGGAGAFYLYLRKP